MMVGQPQPPVSTPQQTYQPPPVTPSPQQSGHKHGHFFNKDN